jgi:hypothetical protein
MEDTNRLVGQFARLPDGQMVIIESQDGSPAGLQCDASAAKMTALVPSVLSQNLSLMILTFR